MQSGATRGISTVSFDDDYFILPMEENIANIMQYIDGAEYLTFMWINYGWLFFDQPVYLTNVRFTVD
jgi:hypothetical protein